MRRFMCFNAMILAVFFALYACAGVPLNDYEPQTVDEEELIEVVMKHESAWNEQDLSGFIAAFHNSALIELDCGGPLVPIKKSSDRIKRVMAEFPRVKFINPRLDITGSEAVVIVTSTELGDEFHLFRLEMQKENGRWLITKETCI